MPRPKRVLVHHHPLARFRGQRNALHSRAGVPNHRVKPPALPFDAEVRVRPRPVIRPEGRVDVSVAGAHDHLPDVIEAVICGARVVGCQPEKEMPPGVCLAAFHTAQGLGRKRKHTDVPTERFLRVGEGGRHGILSAVVVLVRVHPHQVHTVQLAAPQVSPRRSGPGLQRHGGVLA